MHFFVLIFMVTFLSTGFEGLPPIPVVSTARLQEIVKKQFFTTGFEGLPSIPVMFTGSLQGRIDLQGVPCKPYRVWVCSAAARSLKTIYRQIAQCVLPPATSKRVEYCY